MTLFIISLGFGWIVGMLIETFIVSIMLKLTQNFYYKLFFLVLFFTTSLCLWCFQLIPNDINTGFELVHASGKEVPSNSNNQDPRGAAERPPLGHRPAARAADPYIFTMNSGLFDQHLKVDLRDVGDVASLSLIAKAATSAIKYAPAPQKVLAGFTTTLGLGSIYFGNKILNNMQQTREHSLIINDDNITFRSVKNNNDPSSTGNGSYPPSPSSPLEDPSTLEGTLLVLNCLKITLGLAVICFLFYCLYNYINNSIDNKLSDRFKNSFIIKLINLIKTSSKVYTYFWSISTLVYLSGSLFLVIKLYNILNNGF